MTPIEKDKIILLCEEWGLKELNLSKGVFLAEDRSGITVNLRGDVPIVGITIAGELHTEGHGNLKVEDYKREIEAIIKGKTKTSLSSSTEHSEKQPPQNPAAQISPENKSKLGTPDTLNKEVKDDTTGQSTERQEDKDILSTTPGKDQKIEVKGGQESPLPKGKVHKAKCVGCKGEFDITLDAAQKIFEEFNRWLDSFMQSRIEKHLFTYDEYYKRYNLKKCPNCNGTGFVNEKVCRVCNFVGTIEE